MDTHASEQGLQSNALFSHFVEIKTSTFVEEPPFVISIQPSHLLSAGLQGPEKEQAPPCLYSTS